MDSSTEGDGQGSNSSHHPVSSIDSQSPTNPTPVEPENDRVNSNLNNASPLCSEADGGEDKQSVLRTQPIEWSDLARDLQGCNWEQLQERFIEEMDERSRLENTLQKESADLLEVFITWSQTTAFHDEDRAYKRLKTRMDYVQKSEGNLEEKKKHYSSVVKAFESALALLRDE